MTVLWAKQALTANGWAQNVRIEIDNAGHIGSVTINQPADGQQVGVLLPAPVNAHSHAFQRAMAGLTEHRGPNPRDTFWTWRQLMFRFLDQLDPNHVEAISAFVQMEMLEAGYATNVEFHYLHHQPGGTPHDNLAEMSERIAAAAARSGIGLTLLPVYYQFGGCDQRDLGAGQIRFGNTPDRFAQLVEQATAAVRQLPCDCAMGVAPHSLRAVSREGLKFVSTLLPDRPFHMHLAEQVAEVEEVQAYWRKRPVEWLLDNYELSDRWCLIHCTQMEPHETRGLARTSAVAGLCPITESNLGDGIFDGVRWMENNGRIAIGSDSNIRISLSEELRTLEYSQRLRDRTRAALGNTEKSTGRRMFDAICKGGAKAAGRNTGKIEVGAWADLMALDDTTSELVTRRGDAVLDCFLFAGDDHLVQDVWSAGRHLVSAGRHRNRETIVRNYLSTITALEHVL